ncbi:unnamed protein product [Gordionus sp. m RMFG-2023]
MAYVDYRDNILLTYNSTNDPNYINVTWAESRIKFSDSDHLIHQLESCTYYQDKYLRACQCVEDKKSLCVSERCGIKLGDFCISHYECRVSLNETLCINNTCQCQQDMYRNNNICLKGIM